MILKPIKCQYCGANLEIKSDDEIIKCSYCDSKYRNIARKRENFILNYKVNKEKPLESLKKILDIFKPLVTNEFINNFKYEIYEIYIPFFVFEIAESPGYISYCADAYFIKEYKNVVENSKVSIGDWVNIKEKLFFQPEDLTGFLFPKNSITPGEAFEKVAKDKTYKGYSLIYYPFYFIHYHFKDDKFYFLQDGIIENNFLFYACDKPGDLKLQIFKLKMKIIKMEEKDLLLKLPLDKEQIKLENERIFN